MNRILAAASIATLLGAGGALAQATQTDSTPAQTTTMEAEATAFETMEARDVHGALTAMQRVVANELARMGIDTDVEELTMRQLSELALVLSSESSSDQERVDQIRTILPN